MPYHKFSLHICLAITEGKIFKIYSNIK